MTAERATDSFRQRHVVPRPPNLIAPDYWHETRATCVAPVAYYCEYHSLIGFRAGCTNGPATGWAFRADEACRYCLEGEP